MKRYLTVAVIALLAVPAFAQSSRYSSEYGKNTNQVEKIVEDLRRLIEEADRARAADPLFLRDLRRLLTDTPTLGASDSSTMILAMATTPVVLPGR